MGKDLPEIITGQQVLDEVADTRRSRGSVYGDAYVNHKRIAQLWTAFLGFEVEPYQVAICMALTKISRITHSYDHATNHDSYVDLVSYASIAAELASYQERLDAYYAD